MEKQLENSSESLTSFTGEVSRSVDLLLLVNVVSSRLVSQPPTYDTAHFMQWAKEKYREELAGRLTAQVGTGSTWSDFACFFQPICMIFLARKRFSFPFSLFSSRLFSGDRRARRGDHRRRRRRRFLPSGADPTESIEFSEFARRRIRSAERNDRRSERNLEEEFESGRRNSAEQRRMKRRQTKSKSFSRFYLLKRIFFSFFPFRKKTSEVNRTAKEVAARLSLFV